jgi:hypothetical protein
MNKKAKKWKRVVRDFKISRGGVVGNLPLLLL